MKTLQVLTMFLISTFVWSQNDYQFDYLLEIREEPVSRQNVSVNYRKLLANSDEDSVYAFSQNGGIVLFDVKNEKILRYRASGLRSENLTKAKFFLQQTDNGLRNKEQDFAYEMMKTPDGLYHIKKFSDSKKSILEFEMKIKLATAPKDLLSAYLADIGIASHFEVVLLLRKELGENTNYYVEEFLMAYSLNNIWRKTTTKLTPVNVTLPSQKKK